MASYADADGRCVASPARAEQPRLQILKQALAQGGAKCLATVATEEAKGSLMLREQN